MGTDSLFGQLRIILRSLRQAPGYTAVVVMTLGLGIGANSAIYSVIHATLIQALPYEGGGRDLVQLRQTSDQTGDLDIGFSVQEILDYRARSSTLADVAEHHRLYFNLTGAGDPTRVFAGVVSSNFFEMLEVEPLHGRLFLPEDERPDATPAIVLTYDFWMGRMGGDPGALGRTLEMNDLLYTVVGILPSVPLYPPDVDLYMLTTACPFRSGERWIQSRTLRPMRLFGRLSGTANVETVRAELATVAAAVHAEHPDAYPEARRISTTAIPLRDALVEQGRTPFLILFAAAGLVLLIAVANVANLTFARLVRRERELAVRTALGASWGAIAKLVLLEAALLGSAGALVGLGLAGVGVGLLSDFAASYTVRAGEIRIDSAVLLFTAVVGVGAGVLSGIVPLVMGLAGDMTRARVASAAATDDGRKRRLQSVMVVSQVAVSFVLLLASGLTLRSLQNLYRVDPGFGTEQILTMEIPAPFRRPPVESQRFYTDLLDRVRTLPAVQSAAAVMTFPLDGWGRMDTPIQVEGRDLGRDDDPPRADLRTVTSGYFETMGIALVEGRSFTDEDQMDDASVAIVNQALQDRVFPGESALGRRISWNGGDSWLTIVGVAGDVRHYGMNEAVQMELYQPSMMMMNSLIVRADADPSGLLRPITEIVRELDPKQPVVNVATMAGRRSESLASERLITTLLGFFAGLAGLITAAGIGGVVAFTVSQRTKELGIRLALGSSRLRITAMLLAQGIGLTAIGLLLGAGTSRMLGRYVESLLFGIDATDLLTLLGVAMAFLLVATGAVLIPARRVARIDPREALTNQ